MAKENWDLFTEEVEKTPVRGQRCKYIVIFESLSEQGKAALTAAMNNENVTANSITEALKGRGYAIHAWTLRNHRRGGCACPR